MAGPRAKEGRIDVRIGSAAAGAGLLGALIGWVLTLASLHRSVRRPTDAPAEPIASPRDGATEAAEHRSPDLTVAAITAIAAVLGALVGGLATYLGNREVTDRQIREQRQ